MLQKVETLDIMDDETRLRHVKNFIGGLYPPVDKDMMPLYLRDSLDAGTELSRPLDLVYFWHIPKVGSFVRSFVAERVVVVSSLLLRVVFLLEFYFGYKNQIKSPNSFMTIILQYILFIVSSPPPPRHRDLQ